MNKTNVMFINPTRRVELLRSFENYFNVYVACNNSLDPTMICEFSGNLILKEDEYEKCILDYCIDKSIFLIVFWLEKDLEYFSKKRDFFLTHGITLVISKGKGFDMCFDKKEVSLFLKNKGLTYIANEININDIKEFPIVRKRRNGSGGFGVKIVQNVDGLSNFDEETELLTQFYSGIEYTIDIFRADGICSNIVCRRRVKTRGGETIIGIIDQKSNLIKAARKICQVLDLDGPINIQFIFDGDTGEFYCTDINPRFSGGVILSINAGANYPEMVLDYYVKNKIVKEYMIQNYIVGSRYSETLMTTSARIDKLNEISNVEFEQWN